MLEHHSLPESVRRDLRRRILNNELSAGTRLVETNLAAELGVSRTTVRQALRELQFEGLVEIHPRRYSVVTRMSAEDAEDVCYARYALEAGATRESLLGPTEELRRSLESVLQDMADAASRGDVSALVEIDTHFHGIIVRSSGRRRLAELWSSMDSQMGALMRSSLDRQHIELAEVVERHHRVLAAIATGSPAEVEAAIYAHYITDSLTPARLTAHASRDAVPAAREGSR